MLPPPPTALEAISDLDFLEGDCRRRANGEEQACEAEDGGRRVWEWGDDLLPYQAQATTPYQVDMRARPGGTAVDQLLPNHRVASVKPAVLASSARSDLARLLMKPARKRSGLEIRHS